MAVRDMGTGMSAEVMDKALEPFFTTKPQAKGTGLGHSMVYGMMKAHAGAVILRSRLGEGTEVELAFPASRTLQSTRQPGTPAPARVSPPPHPPGGRRRTRPCLPRRHAGGPGPRSACGTGRTGALRDLDSDLEVDLVILDMNMPRMSGAETLARIQALRPDQPGLLTTGYLDDAARSLQEEHPGLGMLAKPFSPEELKQALQA